MCTGVMLCAVATCVTSLAAPWQERAHHVNMVAEGWARRAGPSEHTPEHKFSRTRLCSADSDWPLVAHSLSALPRLGDSRALAGEAQALERGSAKRKPEARVRLFALYGVADESVSLRKWAWAAPAWVEVRVLELPGEGWN